MSRAYREQPHYFSAGAETLFGVATEPTTSPNGIEVLTVCGGGWIPSFHRGQMWARLGRRLAADGYRTFRFDYHGVGESTGTVQFAIDQPLVGDARAALDAFSQGGRTVLVGTCGGARTAAALGADLDDVAGVALMAVPVRTGRSNTEAVKAALSRKVISNLRNPESRKIYRQIAVKRTREMLGLGTRSADGTRGRRRFFTDLAALVDRRVPVLMPSSSPSAAAS